MTGAIVGVLLLTVNPRGGRSMWSGGEMRLPSSDRAAGCGGGHCSLLPDTLEGERQQAHLQYTYGLPRARFRPYAVIAMGSDEYRVVARPWPGGTKRRGGWAAHPVE